MTNAARRPSSPRRARLRRRPRLERLEDRLAPATFTVSNTSSLDVPGSLFRAVQDANLAAGPDRILFDPAVFGLGKITALTLTRALPELTDHALIQGPAGVRLTIARAGGADNFRLLTIAPDVTADIRDLAFTGGRADRGGGVLNEGTLLLTNCTVEGNTAAGSAGVGGGIANEDGTLILNRSVVRDNEATTAGGGVYLSGGNVAAVNCTFAGNTAGSGGGLFVQDSDAAMDLLNCTVSGNGATTLDAKGGGGILVEVGRGLLAVNLYSCTVADNTAGGGGGGLLVYGGQESPALVRFQNTLFADNAGGDLRDDGPAGPTGAAQSLGNNLSTDASALLTEPTDLPGTPALLRPLGDYGGPVPTQALLPGSPAIDRGTVAAGITSDARGRARPAGRVDIGAYEAGAYALTVVSGDGQAAPVGGTFGEQLVVRLTEDGQLSTPATRGVPVTFTSVGPEAVAFRGSPSATVTIDSEGLGVSPLVTAGPSGGPALVTATVGGLTQTFALTVRPRLVVGGDEFTNVGSVFRRTGRIEGLGEGSFVVTIDFGDGTDPQVVDVAADGTFAIEHVFKDEGSFDVRVMLNDGEAQATFSADVLLAGVPIDGANKVTIDPGQTGIAAAPGVRVVYHHAAQATGPASVIVAVVPEGVAEGLGDGAGLPAGDVQVTAYDVRALHVHPADFATATFHYEGDGEPTLFYYDRAAKQYLPVPPSLVSVDKAHHTIKLVLDARSVPALGSLTGTVFAIAVPVAAEVPPPVTPPGTGGGGGGVTPTTPISLGVLANAPVAILLAQRATSAGGLLDAARAAGADTAVVAVLLGVTPPNGPSPGSPGYGGGAAEGQGGGEGGPLSDLPVVPPVLTDLPGATLTPAGSDPAVISGSEGGTRPEMPPAPSPEEEPPSGEEGRAPIDEVFEGMEQAWAGDPRDGMVTAAAAAVCGVGCGRGFDRRERRRRAAKRRLSGRPSP